MKGIVTMKKRTFLLGMVVLCLVLGICCIKEVYAKDEIVMKLSCDKRDVLMNSEIEISLRVTSPVEMDKIETEIVFSKETLEFVSGDGCSKESDGKVLLKSDMKSKDKTFELKFKAVAPGQMKVATGGIKKEILESLEKKDMDVKSSCLRMRCNPKKTGDEDTYDLASLVLVSDGKQIKLAKDVAPDVYTYSTVVDNEVSNVKLEIKPANNKTKVVQEESYNLEAGKISCLTFNLVGEDGIECPFYVNVYRRTKQEMLDLRQNEEEDEEEDEFEKIVEVEENNGDLYIKGVSYYQILEPSADAKVPDGFESIEVDIEGSSVKAYNYKDTNEEYILLYAKNLSTDEENFYVYDSVESTLQRYNDGLNIVINKKDTDNILDKMGEQNITIAIVIGVLVFLLVGVGFFALALRSKYNKMNADIQEACNKEQEQINIQKQKEDDMRQEIAKRNKKKFLDEVAKLNIAAEQDKIEGQIAKQVLASQKTQKIEEIPEKVEEDSANTN